MPFNLSFPFHWKQARCQPHATCRGSCVHFLDPHKAETEVGKSPDDCDPLKPEDLDIL